MKAAHTPGPWSMVTYPADEDGHDRCAYIDALNATHRFRSSLAHVFFDDDLDVRDANARLIAAAPELLEALHAVADLVDGKLAATNPHAPYAFALVRDAIAKAEGRDL